MQTETQRTMLIIARKNRRINELVRTRKSQAQMIQRLNWRILELERLTKRANKT